MDTIRDNLDQIEENIQLACQRSGRSRSEVTLIAVSKTKPVEALQEAMDCGVVTFGENRVQELTDKMDYFQNDRSNLHWHMIGHLQTNKVKYLIGRVDMIHSVDSVKLAKVIEQESAKRDVVTDILLEVNIGEEESKFGLKPEEVEEVVREISSFPHVCIRGLMTVAPYTEDPEWNRPYFREMKKLLVDIASKNIDNINMNVLSMGMSGDYQVAIEEGATCIRVGTSLFGHRDYSI